MKRPHARESLCGILQETLVRRRAKGEKYVARSSTLQLYKHTIHSDRAYVCMYNGYDILDYAPTSRVLCNDEYQSNL